MLLIVEQFVERGFGWTKPSPSSKKNYRTHIMQFEFFLRKSNKTAQDGTVSDQDILDYVKYLRSKYKPNTVAAKMAAIKSYFRWLKEEGALIRKPYIRSIASIKVEHKELEKSALETMIKNMEGNALNKRRDQAMFALFLYCGFKTEEIVAMNTEDVDFENAQITILRKSKYATNISQTKKCSFNAALKELQAYKKAKLDKGFHWKNLAENATVEKSPFFLNKHHLRISGRSFRRRLTTYLGKSNSYSMRDIRHTYLKSLDRTVKAECPIEV